MKLKAKVFRGKLIRKTKSLGKGMSFKIVRIDKKIADTWFSTNAFENSLSRFAGVFSLKYTQNKERDKNNIH
jgi:hypothetical protein